jgi:hypothetical protein
LVYPNNDISKRGSPPAQRVNNHRSAFARLESDNGRYFGCDRSY